MPFAISAAARTVQAIAAAGDDRILVLEDLTQKFKVMASLVACVKIHFHSLSLDRSVIF